MPGCERDVLDAAPLTPAGARVSSATGFAPGGNRPRYRLRAMDYVLDITPGRDFVIGRAEECDVQLTGGFVSRRHARLWETPDGLLVEDLASRNGVTVNGQKIAAPTALAHQDMVGIGLQSFEVTDEHVLHHPPHLSTIPPPRVAPRQTEQRLGRGPAPPGEADVDAPEQSFVTAQTGLLSAREREVLELLVLGHTQREIAQKLCLSVKTIEAHRAHIVEKLGCGSRAELVTYAISAGLLTNVLRRR